MNNEELLIFGQEKRKSFSLLNYSLFILIVN